MGPGSAASGTATTADAATAAVAPPPTDPALAVVLTGVSGSGKSTVGKLLAERLGWEWADGDSFHSAANIQKMVARRPLTDADRLPWLAEIGAWISQETATGRSVVMACSALKRSYRDLLRQGRPQVRLVYLVVDPDTLRTRMRARSAHMFVADMLASQLADLQPPTPDERVTLVRSQDSVAATVDQVIAVEHLERYLRASTS